MFRFIVIASISLAFLDQLKAQPLEPKLREEESLVPASTSPTTNDAIQTTSASPNASSTATPSGGDTNEDESFFLSGVSFVFGFAFVFTCLFCCLFLICLWICGFGPRGIIEDTCASRYQSSTDRRRQRNEFGSTDIINLYDYHTNGFPSFMDRDNVQLINMERRGDTLCCCFRCAQSFAMNPCGRVIIFSILVGTAVSIAVRYWICPSMV